MRQALTIFRKDVRHLRFEIAVVLVITAAFTFIGARQASWLDDPNVNRNVAWTLILVLLPLAWCTLIARAVHSEPLPGDRQFWITRPYEWKSLLLAKLLLMAAFVNVPLLIADAVIVRAFGFSLGTEVPGLLWTQVLLLAVFVLPVAALSSVTTGFVQLSSTGFVLFLAVLAWLMAAPGSTLGATWGSLDWIPVYFVILVTFLGALAILICQYSRRRTWPARSLAAFVTLLAMAGSVLIPWTAAFSIQSRFAKKDDGQFAGIHVGFDIPRKWLARVIVGEDVTHIELPLAITGLPAETSPKPDGLVATIDSAEGPVMRIVRNPWKNFDTEGNILTMEADVDASLYRKMRTVPVSIRGSLYFTLYGNRETARVPFGGRFVRVPRMGVCSAQRGERGDTYFLLCSSAFRWPPDLVSIRFLGQEENTIQNIKPYSPAQRISYSPFPADMGISPINQYFTYRMFAGHLSEVAIDSVEPLSHMHRTFEIQGLLLSDFEVWPIARPAN
jgi:hypothetical protein